MKKGLLLIPLFLISLVASAEVISINNSTADALRLALNSANDGDIIEMSAGTYVESNSNYIAFTGKTVTVRAASGANVIVQPKVPIIISGGGKAVLKNIKIDASRLTELASWYEHVIYPNDASANNRLEMDGCEVYGYTVGKAVIACRSSYKLDSLIINNCKFYNHTTRSCVFLENTENKGLIVTNSTFYNIATGSVSFGAGIIDDRSTTAKVRVDHCTFYNVVAQSTDYAAVGKVNISDAIVSNCIFMLPTNTDGERAIRGVAQANNCLTYNYIKDSNWGIHGDVTKSNCINGKDPLFTNAASGDFSFAGNWATGSISPARGAATDGSDLGDPRWYTDETLPSTDLRDPYLLAPAKAKLTKRVALSDNNLAWDNTSDATQNGGATWKIHITRACPVSVTINNNASNTSGHCYSVEILDADGNTVGSALAEDKTNWSHSNDALSGYINIPAAGDFTVRLSNSTASSEAILAGITLSYTRGMSITIPAKLLPEDALLSTYARMGHGTVDTLYFAREGKEWESNDESYTVAGSQYVKWNIKVTKAGKYKFTANTYCKQGHNYRFIVLNQDESSTLYTKQEAEGAGSDYHNEGADWQFATDLVELAVGSYVLKMQSKSWGRVMSVVATYEGGAVTNIPGYLKAEDAILEAKKMCHEANGDIHYSSNYGVSPTEEYAYWRIHATAAYSGRIILDIPQENASGHEFHVELYSSLDGSPLSSAYEETLADGKSHHEKGLITLDQTFAIPSSGDYFVKLVNATKWSSSLLRGISIASVLEISDQNTTANTPITANDGNTVNAHLTRAFTGGMYNTICLPFDVSAAEVARVFPGAKIKELKSSSIESDGFVLNLNFDDVTSMEAGKPYLIWPTGNVSNPTFLGVTIDKDLNPIETTNADFIGNYVKDDVPAGENNFFLGAENKLFYSNTATEIDGLRAYIQVKVGSGSPAPTRARIVEQGNVATELEIIGDTLPESIRTNNVRKFILDGQLVIVKDGVYYNAFGVKVK